MEKLKCWITDIAGGLVSLLCWFSDVLKWFTPDHCDHIAKIIAVFVGIITLFFITIPKAWPNIKRFKRKYISNKQ